MAKWSMWTLKAMKICNLHYLQRLNTVCLISDLHYLQRLHTNYWRFSMKSLFASQRCVVIWLVAGNSFIVCQKIRGNNRLAPSITVNIKLKSTVFVFFEMTNTKNRFIWIVMLIWIKFDISFNLETNLHQLPTYSDTATRNVIHKIIHIIHNCQIDSINLELTTQLTRNVNGFIMFWFVALFENSVST